jgi:hypothetical protein
MKLFYTLIAIVFFQITSSQNQEFASDRIILAFNDSRQIMDIQDINNIDTLQFLYNELTIEKIKLLDEACSFLS